MPSQLSIIDLKKVEDSEVELADYFPVAKGDPPSCSPGFSVMWSGSRLPVWSHCSKAFFEDEQIAALFEGHRRPRGFITSTSAVFWSTPFPSCASSIGRRPLSGGQPGSPDRRRDPPRYREDLRIFLRSDRGIQRSGTPGRPHRHGGGDGRRKDRGDPGFSRPDGHGAPPPILSHHGVSNSVRPSGPRPWRR